MQSSLLLTRHITHMESCPNQTAHNQRPTASTRHCPPGEGCICPWHGPHPNLECGSHPDHGSGPHLNHRSGPYPDHDSGLNPPMTAAHTPAMILAHIPTFSLAHPTLKHSQHHPSPVESSPVRSHPNTTHTTSISLHKHTSSARAQPTIGRHMLQLLHNVPSPHTIISCHDPSCLRNHHDYMMLQLALRMSLSPFFNSVRTSSS